MDKLKIVPLQRSIRQCKVQNMKEQMKDMPDGSKKMIQWITLPTMKPEWICIHWMVKGEGIVYERKPLHFLGTHGVEG